MVRAANTYADRWYVQRDYDFGERKHTDWIVGPINFDGSVYPIEVRTSHEDIAREVAIRHNAEVDASRAATARVVAADAVADSPTDGEIDEAVTHAIAWEPAPGDDDIMPLARHLTLWGEFRVSGGGAA